MIQCPASCRVQCESFRTPIWVPAVFQVGRNYACRILSPINNIDMVADKDLYATLAAVFARIVRPLETTMRRSLAGRMVQVIVKAQKYVLHEGETYEVMMMG